MTDPWVQAIISGIVPEELGGVVIEGTAVDVTHHPSATPPCDCGVDHDDDDQDPNPEPSDDDPRGLR